ncbi:leucine-rich repeat and IQ domain-containing protein 3 isoform X2 [Cricetulus griseus]|uniref:Leucine-rich repeat and IQ domain-containing protein 3 isoform X2 n=1 Tax=Cricetulus griseus TaxID=10029 RepID=A0A9J7F901_CRIGR|nr:leucine-rich repeat and IQ domain-containing protein 3 isoform X2 [Cricetulus griseus]
MFHGTITKELTSHEEWNHYNENIIENKKDFVFVKYNGLHLKSMENLQSCISLKVCIFSNNFITDIQPLQCCIKLIKLDLHGNQIKILPDRNFWIGLKNLKLLYLHDNSFCKLKNICVLAACASLIGLTMFDCPVSLKKGYRHVLVNSIWPLKALDHHVISDEEIIQNWHLPERFKAFNPRLFFKFCPALIKMRCTPADFKHSADYRKHISCLSYELKSKDIDRKPQTPSHPIQKGQKESKADSEDEEMDISFRVSTLKIPLYSSPSLKYGSVLKEMKPDYFSDYLQPIPGTHPKPPIKRETLEELKKRKEFLASQRAGMKLFMFNDLDKYHSDRKHQEKQTEKSAVVVLAQAARSRARYSIRESLRKKTILAQKLMERDNEAIQKGLRQIWKEKLAYLEKVRERKTMFLAEKKLNALDHSLVQNTNNERTLLLKGIFQVDKMKKEMEELRQKHLIVVEQWRTEKFKQSMLRHMKEMRAEEIRKRHSEEKFVIDTLIFQKALARLEEAKAKADYIRTNYTSKSYKRA